MAAAVTKLGLLLIALINSGIHGEENFSEIMEKAAVYTFQPPKEAKYCVISRSIGEENLVLWNTSDPSAENPSLPEDLKKRLEVSKKENISSYEIHSLTHSDSGLYREECWTDVNVTHQWNTSITVCSTIEKERLLVFRATGIMDIPCKSERVGDNLTVLMFRSKGTRPRWSRMFMDDNRSLNPLMKHLEGGLQLVENSSSLRIFNFTRRDVASFTCLEMEKQQCVSSKPLLLFPQTEYIFHSVGEEAVLPCFDTDLYGPPRIWFRLDDEKTFLAPPSQNKSSGFGNLTGREQQYGYSDDPVVNANFSLVFSSLTLNHSGTYQCGNDKYNLYCFLVVCPESDPLTQFFSHGEEVTLSCNNSKSGYVYWFRKTEQEEGVIFDPIVSIVANPVTPELYEGLKDRLNVSSVGTTLVLSNLSPEDSGEYWCMPVIGDCELTPKTILIYKHPFGIDSTFYAVWLSCGVLWMVCGVVTVSWILKTRG